MKRLIPLIGLAALPVWAAAECPDLTALQRAAGFVTWQNFLQLAGIGLIAGGTLFFCSGLVRRFLQQVRLIESLLWILTVTAIVGGAFAPKEWQIWPVLAGCLMLPGAAALSGRLRGLPFDPTRFFGTMGAVWAAAALFYQFDAVGFLAVMAFLALLGLHVAVGPFCYALGFRDHDSVLRGTLAGALLAIGYGAIAATQLDVGPIAVFRAGALWLGTFAWFIGVLIVSVRWYPGGGYLRRQAVALLSLVGALSAGLLLGVREFTVMAATFLLFYVAGKVIEVPLQGRIGFGVKLMAAGGLMSTAWYFTKDLSMLLV